MIYVLEIVYSNFFNSESNIEYHWKAAALLGLSDTPPNDFCFNAFGLKNGARPASVRVFRNFQTLYVPELLASVQIT